jgi:hypothetical protein
VNCREITPSSYQLCRRVSGDMLREKRTSGAIVRSEVVRDHATRKRVLWGWAGKENKEKKVKQKEGPGQKRNEGHPRRHPRCRARG